MKKAEEYFNTLDIRVETEYTDVGPFNWVQNCTKEDILEIIEKVQIDAIDETVKRCAEEAIAIYDPCEYSNIIVDRQSILNVADELKEKLE